MCVCVRVCVCVCERGAYCASDVSLNIEGASCRYQIACKIHEREREPRADESEFVDVRPHYRAAEASRLKNHTASM